MNGLKKILIVDDTESNLVTGRLLETQGHKVSYARDYSEAIKLAGFPRFPARAPERVETGLDLLLTDLFLPWGKDDQRPHKEEGIHPLGYGLVLSALANGVPYVGMITNQNHHSGPLAATWDFLPSYSCINAGRTILGVWDERGCISEDDNGNQDRFFQSKDKLISVSSGESLKYENNPEWTEIKPIKHWHEAAKRLLSYKA